MPNKPLEHYLDGSYQIEVIPEGTPNGPIFLARLKSMPTCSAQGSTQEDALTALEYIRKAHITRRHERGAEIPDPDLPQDQRVITRTVQGGGSALVLVDVPFTAAPDDNILVKLVD